MYKIIRPILFSLSAEKSHNLSLTFLNMLNRGYLKTLLVKPPKHSKPVNVMGIDFANPVGLAAGLDKNGQYIDALANLGFGFIEIGTVTPRAQTGNPLPRLFRLKSSRAIINRMGFNNKGVDYMIEQVKRAKYQGILGINIGKNFDTPIEKAVDDYLYSMDRVYPHASYIAINISSPNTPGLRRLQYGDELEKLIIKLKQRQLTLSQQYNKYVPIALKIAPDLDKNEIKSIASILIGQKVDCLIATNTTLSREGVLNDSQHIEKGGLSGAPLTLSSTEVIRQFSYYLKDKIPLIGVGGILSGQDAHDKLVAGASLIQLYSGLVYEGPELIAECIEHCIN